MDKVELVQEIGNEICEGCGPDADCGENPQECGRVLSAIEMLDDYLARTRDINPGTAKP